MIIFLYGEDTYSSRQKLKEIVEHYKKVHKSGLDFNNLDFSDPQSSLSDLKDQVFQVSMFQEKKMVVVKNAFSKAKTREEILEEIEKFQRSDDIILFYEEGKIDQRTNLFKALKKNAKCQEFQLLEEQRLKTWAKKEFAKYKTEIDLKDVDKLVDYVGNDLWRMKNEILKLVNFRKNKRIKSEDIDSLVRPEVETDIFGTIDAIARKDKQKALNLLHKHLEKGDNPLYLLSMIIFQFRNLLIVKDLAEKRNTYNGILKKSGLHPFVVKKSYFQAQKFGTPELKKIYHKIFQVDLDIKTGKIEPGLALDLLISEI